jgi:hypothetical protein
MASVLDLSLLLSLWGIHLHQTTTPGSAPSDFPVIKKEGEGTRENNGKFTGA